MIRGIDTVLMDEVYKVAGRSKVVGNDFFYVDVQNADAQEGMKVVGKFWSSTRGEQVGVGFWFPSVNAFGPSRQTQKDVGSVSIDFDGTFIKESSNIAYVHDSDCKDIKGLLGTFLGSVDGKVSYFQYVVGQDAKYVNENGIDVGNIKVGLRSMNNSRYLFGVQGEDVVFMFGLSDVKDLYREPGVELGISALTQINGMNIDIILDVQLGDIKLPVSVHTVSTDRYSLIGSSYLKSVDAVFDGGSTVARISGQGFGSWSEIRAKNKSVPLFEKVV